MHRTLLTPRRLWPLALALIVASLALGGAGWLHASPRAEAAARGIECRGIRCGRLFVIAVGVDGAPGDRFATRYAESDAERLARRLAWEYRFAGDTAVRRQFPELLPRADSSPEAAALLARAVAAVGDTLARAQVAVLTGANASLEHLERAFARVMAQARPGDRFVFYFGGSSRDVTDSTTGTSEHYFRLGAVRDFASDADLRAGGLSSGQLRYWLDNVNADRQLVVLEAGESDQFLPRFVASMIEQDANAARLTTRDRVIVGPQKVGMELHGIGGVMTYLVARSHVPLLEIFERGATVAMGLESVIGREQVRVEEPYVRIFRERDFLDIYRAVAARQPAAMRGLEAQQQSAAPRAKAGRNTALVIGTNRYDAAANWARLVNPAVDARAVATELARSFGFDTTVLIDPSRDEVLGALVALADREYGEHDQLVVFIAGHGYYDEKMKMGHLVARDSRPLAEDRFLQSYLSHGLLAQYLDAIPSRHTLLVMDACFGGAFADDVAAGSRSEEYADAELATLIERKLAYQSRLYITSGGKEYVPDGRPDQHSPFARRFLGTLRDAAAAGRPLTISGLRAGVESARPGPRSGEFGNSEPGGDILLIPVAGQ